MSTVAVLAANLPKWITIRYSIAIINSWLNQLLEELSGEGLMPEMNYQTGVVTNADSWITKPTGFRKILSLRSASDLNHNYNYDFVNGKIFLTNETVAYPTDIDQATTFSASLTTGITANIADASVDSFKDYLLRITASTLDVYTGNTYILSGNAVSALGVCALTYKHSLATALVAASITGADLIPPDYYLLMEYVGSYTALTSVTGADEFPIDNRYELRIFDAWCRYKAEAHGMQYGNETLESYNNYQRVLKSIQAEILTKPSEFRGRRFPSFPNAR